MHLIWATWYSSCDVAFFNDLYCAANPTSKATHHSASPTVPASQQSHVSSLVSAQPTQQAAPGMQCLQQAAGTNDAVLQQSASSPTQVNDPQADPQAGSQAHPHADPKGDSPAEPQADQQNLPRLSQTAGTQYLQQHRNEAQQLQQSLNKKQQLQQHGSTSDTPQSATEAARARPRPDAWRRQQAGELAAGTGQSAEPVAVFTSAVTGAGLRELLLQVERKVCACCNCMHACFQATAL